MTPKPPNAEGQTMCIVRWMVVIPGHGWLGAFDRTAFDAYVTEAVAAERERCAKLCDQIDAMSRDPMVCRGSAEECAAAIRA